VKQFRHRKTIRDVVAAAAKIPVQRASIGALCVIQFAPEGDPVIRVGRALLLAIAMSARAGASQAPSLPGPSFEAVSVKEGTGTRVAAHWEGPRFVSAGVPLQTLIAVAYGVPLYELSGLPEWVRTVGWEINALASRAPAPSEQTAFLRAILEDRFRIVARVATEERPIYTLTLATPGGRSPGLKPSEIDCVGVTGTPPVAVIAQGLCNLVIGPSVYTRRGVGVDALTSALRTLLRQTVVDRTGLTGLYDFDLHFRPLTAGPIPPELDGLPDLQTAVQEQLGLKLEPGRASVAVTIFDRVERPTPN
jgi:uncharacterized protein (TIGR03435 family)